MQNGKVFSTDGSRLNVSEADRESLSLGLRLRDGLSDSVSVEGNVSLFDILKDEARSSALNPDDPGYSSEGEVTTDDDTGWRTAVVKLTIDDVGTADVSVVTGLRYDSFESRERYFANDDAATPGLDLTATPGISHDQFSPKFSLGFRPGRNNWQLRYSLGGRIASSLLRSSSANLARLTLKASQTRSLNQRMLPLTQFAVTDVDLSPTLLASARGLQFAPPAELSVSDAATNKRQLASNHQNRSLRAAGMLDGERGELLQQTTFAQRPAYTTEPKFIS